MTGAPLRVAIVLGAAVRADGTPSPTLARRVARAVALLDAGEVDAICLTGGRGRHGPVEAVVGGGLARRLGAPDAALILEDRSADTVGNLACALDLLPPGAALTLVSNGWHLPRAALVLRVLGRHARLSGIPSETSGVARALSILREVAATPRSLLRALRARSPPRP